MTGGKASRALLRDLASHTSIFGGAVQSNPVPLLLALNYIEDNKSTTAEVVNILKEHFFALYCLLTSDDKDDKVNSDGFIAGTRVKIHPELYHLYELHSANAVKITPPRQPRDTADESDEVNVLPMQVLMWLRGLIIEVYISMTCMHISYIPVCIQTLT